MSLSLRVALVAAVLRLLTTNPVFGRGALVLALIAEAER